MGRREANERPREKGRVLGCIATPHCVESDKLLEHSRLHADMTASVRARATEGIIMTAQSVEKDGQKQTEWQTDRQTEWGRGEKMTYINKTAIITMERLQRGTTAKVGAAL